MDVEIHFEELTILHWEIVFKKIKGTYKAVTHAALVSVSVAGKCTSAVSPPRAICTCLCDSELYI